MLRLASAKVVPKYYTHRAIASSRFSGSITNAFSSTANNSIENPNFVSHNLCDAKKLEVDRRLVQVLKYRIRLVKLEASMPATPADFPFPIEHSYFDQLSRDIFLTRKLDGEKIQYLVESMSSAEEDSDPSDTDDDDDEINNNTSSTQSNSKQNEKSLGLSVYISKLQDELVFRISASADNFTIDEIMFRECTSKYDGHLLHFGSYEMDEESDLQNAVKEYLEIRGIKKTHFGFLYEYLSGKIKQAHLLKKARNFIKE